MTDAFEEGGVVRLKSGGPAMTVTSVGTDFGDKPMVWCAWFDQKVVQQSGSFPPAALEKDE